MSDCECHDCRPDIHEACTNKPYCCASCYPHANCPARNRRMKEAEERTAGTPYHRFVQLLAKLCRY